MSGRKLANKRILVKPHGIVTRESTDAAMICDDELRPVLAYIHDNLSTVFGAAEIASALKMSRQRLDRLFTARLGHSVGAEIARHRISLAKKLLRNTEMSATEIASRCGYCNRSFFIKRFKAAVGATPHVWRRKR